MAVHDGFFFHSMPDVFSAFKKIPTIKIGIFFGAPESDLFLLILRLFLILPSKEANVLQSHLKKHHQGNRQQ